MKKLITSVCFLFLAVLAVAQTTSDDYYSPSSPKLFSREKVVTSLSMGTSVSFLNSSGGTGVTTFIAPKIGYQLTKKFQLNVGFMHYTLAGNTFMPLNNQEALYNRGNRSVSGNMVFAEGIYQLNKRVSLNGAVMMDAGSLNNKQNNYKALSLGMDYKVGEHSYIGIKATVAQGNNENYFFNPKNNSFEYNPNGFSNPFSGLVSGFGQNMATSLNSITR